MAQRTSNQHTTNGGRGPTGANNNKLGPTGSNGNEPTQGRTQENVHKEMLTRQNTRETKQDLLVNTVCGLLPFLQPLCKVHLLAPDPP